jgi:hypothetical protein
LTGRTGGDWFREGDGWTSGLLAWWWSGLSDGEFRGRKDGTGSGQAGSTGPMAGPAFVLVMMPVSFMTSVTDVELNHGSHPTSTWLARVPSTNSPRWARHQYFPHVNSTDSSSTSHNTTAHPAGSVTTVDIRDITESNANKRYFWGWVANCCKWSYVFDLINVKWLFGVLISAQYAHFAISIRRADCMNPVCY